MGEEADLQDQEQDSQTNQPSPDYVPAVTPTNNQQVEKIKTSIDSQTAVMIIVLALVLVGVVGGSVWFSMNRQVTDLQAKNAELTKSIADLKKVNTVSSNGSVTVNSSGLATTKVTMYRINNLNNSTWKSDIMDFSAKSAIRTTVIADMGNFRDNYKNKDWVGVQIDVTDNRTSGQNLTIDVSNSIRLVDGTNKIPPLESMIGIMPLQTKTIYAIFPVDKDSKVFKLWTGDLAKPTITDLDFRNAEAPYGYFLMKSGYSTTLQ